MLHYFVNKNHIISNRKQIINIKLINNENGTIRPFAGIIRTGRDYV